MQPLCLAMGNNLAPVLATIYMNELDNEILVRSNGCVTLKRFINDYFNFLRTKDLRPNAFLKQLIKFTLELPNNDHAIAILERFSYI